MQVDGPTTAPTAGIVIMPELPEDSFLTVAHVLRQVVYDYYHRLRPPADSTVPTACQARQLHCICASSASSARHFPLPTTSPHVLHTFSWSFPLGLSSAPFRQAYSVPETPQGLLLFVWYG